MNKLGHNKSLHWVFTPLRSVKTSEFKRYVLKRYIFEELIIGD
ncbi:MAG: hypothetical protein V3T09_03720 [bacterium]